MTLGERLKFLREHTTQISQAELSRRSGVRRATIVDLEGGKITWVYINTAAKLARGLGVSLDNLMQDVDVSDLMAAVA